MSSSEELLQQASRGDDGAVAVLLERHLPGLRAFLRLRAGKLVRAKESVSDLVQSVCREVIVHAERFRHGGELGFKQWLYTTALRKLSHRREYWEAARRAAGREAVAEDGDAELLQCYASFVTPSRVASAREEIERVEAAFDRLSEAHREVIVLAKVLGLSRAEIAAHTGRSEVAVRSLLHRALAELSELVDAAR